MADLEHRLRALAEDAFPPAPDVRAAVAARIAAAEPGGRVIAEPGARALGRIAPSPAARARPRAGARARAERRDRRRTRRAACGARLARARRTSASSGCPTARPSPALDLADLGPRVAAVDEAARRAGFAVEVPRALGTPDAVFVSDGGIVSLAYEPRPGLPRDPQTGLGLLVTSCAPAG